jgi:hypothetical protein
MDQVLKGLKAEGKNTEKLRADSLKLRAKE